ncbi:hypothetical protein PACTADRAFT_76711 [Pachysolen tannophilus NRRL Y-2460]|uniref:Alkaline phosphatase n=1 Tax=Pachysolen tannophilus NRRL Y-2460 TaxID=669874 RepID=A0A1E4TQP4_PACTA|nr:hypothetical protein PACTADRAFT_76711 [Pachysolen tannophilus NRRL Y-2460]
MRSQVGLVSLFLGLLLYLLVSVDAQQYEIGSKKKKNIIFMVSDGMGPASLSLARSFRQYRDNLPYDDILTLDKHLIGSSRTMSSSSLVTDSAAGATAFSCSLKTYNGAIGIDQFKKPCGTILEALKLKGYMTGMVVTTRITDATPASFSSHAEYRYQEDLIAQQQLGDYPLGRMVDLIIGGGKCHFLPNSIENGCRNDNLNLIEKALKDGWSIINNKLEFDYLNNGFNASLPLLALLAPGDIPYDLDRDPLQYPSLEEQTITALNALNNSTKNSDKGFFLLVEGSRIDHAGHSNDPAAQVREVLAYDKAFEAALKFAQNSDDETIIISTSDHETGGLVTARQISPSYPDYIWYPQALLNATHSGEFITKKLLDFKNNSGNKDNSQLSAFVQKEILEKDLGIFDYTAEDIDKMIKGSALDVANNLVSIRSQTGWTTHGHSAVDVNIYAYGNSEKLMNSLYRHLGGNHENIEIGKFMEKWLDVDLQKITKLVKDTKFKDLALELEIQDQEPILVHGPNDEEDDEWHENVANY